MADLPEASDHLNEKKLQELPATNGGSELETIAGPSITKDGIALHPQPTSDPLDPLNWSSVKKHGILAIVMAL